MSGEFDPWNALGCIVIAFFVYLSIIAIRDESVINDGLSLRSGMLQIEDAGR